jgi:hypothetical protein
VAAAVAAAEGVVVAGVALEPHAPAMTARADASTTARIRDRDLVISLSSCARMTMNEAAR